MKVPNDIALVTRVVSSDDKRAFDTLVRRYQSAVRRFFMSHTAGDTQLSDDLAQDTFIKAYTRLGTFGGKSTFPTWLYRIAYNTLYDYIRSHKVTESITASTACHCPTTTQGTTGLDIYKAMGVLTQEERTCITLQLMDGLPINDISEITGIPAGTVKSHLSRGKKRLATYLRQNGYNRK